MKIYRFRNCLLNTVERRVLKDGEYVDLTPKTFDVLRLLVESNGNVVTKDEILKKVWNGSFVEEGNLAVHISKLRRLLDETKNNPFIETVSGSGYRFVAPVQIAGSNDWPKNNSLTFSQTDDKFSREWLFNSIAVLPLNNESRNEEIDYLADGLTESVINNLSRVSGLKVIARNTVFRYKNKNVDAREVGETLGVSTVLTGRIKVIKDKLIISVELINVADDTQLWGTQFNQSFSDIIKIQEEITSTVSEKLKSEIKQVAKSKQNNPITNNAESYRLYLKGKYFLEKRTETDIYKAIQCFQQSIFYDPMNFYAYVEMIEGYCSLYAFDYIAYNKFLSKVVPLVSTTLEINQTADLVQAMYGRKFYLEWKFDKAEKHFRQALEVNPNCLIARYRYMEFCTMSRSFFEASKQLNYILRIDPLSLMSYLIIGKLLYRMERYENAKVFLIDALELEPNNFEVLAVLGAVLIELEDYELALKNFQRSLEIHYNIEVHSMVAFVKAMNGQSNEAIKIIKQIQKKNGINKYLTIISRVYLALGDKETAYYYLEQAIELHEIDLIALNSDPRFAKIRNEPKFKDIVLKIGIPLS